MEDPNSPAVSMRISKLPMTDTVIRKAKIFHIDVVGAFLQARMRSIFFIAGPKVYGEVFPEFKECILWQPSVTSESHVCNDNSRQVLV
jgi:hypothetical protein